MGAVGTFKGLPGGIILEENEEEVRGKEDDGAEVTSGINKVAGEVCFASSEGSIISNAVGNEVPTRNVRGESNKNGNSKLRMVYCYYCEYSSYSKTGLSKHIQRHLPSRMCPMCNATFRWDCKLRVHLELKHSYKKESVGVPLCGKRIVKKVRYALPKSDKKEFGKCHLKPWEGFCFHCGYSSKIKTGLSKHVQGHLPPYTCTVCNAKFRLERKFKAHVELEHPDSREEERRVMQRCRFPHSKRDPKQPKERCTSLPWTGICYYCGYSSSIKTRLSKHIQKHLPPHMRTACGAKFRSEYKCRVHLRRDLCTNNQELGGSTNRKSYRQGKRSSDRLVSCLLCKDQAKSRRFSENHMTHCEGMKSPAEVLKPKVFFCYYCHWCAKERHEMAKHIKEYHSTSLSSIALDCMLCSYKFETKMLLERHIISAHNAEKPYACDRCNFRTKYQQALEGHKQIHKNHQPSSIAQKSPNVFFCCYCHWCATGQDELAKHLKENHLSSASPPEHSCTQCSYKATNKKKLNHHITQSHNVKKRTLMCILCGYETTIRTKLVMHMERSHSIEKPFTCDICDYRTSKEEFLIQHRRVHTGEKPFACEWCDYRSARPADLSQHKKTHTGIKKHVCDVCDHRFARKTQLTEHKRTHTGSKPFACDKCDFRATRAQSLTDHMRIHTGELPYACDQCDYRARISDSLLKHKKRHTLERLRGNTRSYSCGMCDYTAKFPAQVRFHRKKVHVKGSDAGDPTGELYACDVCDFSTTHARRLQKHQQIHSGEKPYACDICDYRAIRKDSLSIHRRKHTGEQPYACDKCEYKTHSSGNLSYHVKLHLDEKPLACDMCDYRTYFHKRLVVHKRKHSGEKPYACDKCNYRTSAKQPFVNHIRIHTGEKPYTCDWCDYRGHSAAALRLHNKTEHPENMYACGTCSFQDTSKFKVDKHLNKCHPTPSTDEIETPRPNLVSNAGTIRLLYNCSKCSFSDRSRFAVEEHLLECHPEIPLADQSIWESSVWESD